MKLLLVLFVVGAMALAVPVAMAQWNEVGDAGDLPGTAQVPTCNPPGAPLTTISGTLSSDTDADMYCIGIVNEAVFTANTCGTAFDTQLFLFYGPPPSPGAAGTGIAANDDCPAGGPCPGTLQSALSTTCISANGNYLIAISGYDRDPAAGGVQLFPDSPFTTEFCGPTPVVNGWIGFGDNGSYTIRLTGTSCCTQATPVQQTTWGGIKATYRN